MKKAEKIFLVGLMGSGKTTLGKMLANEKGIEFIDLDEEIEASEQKTITDIFQEKGENVFRLKEAEMLRRIIQGKESFVMATGGGTPCFGDNMDLICKSGNSVFLDVPPSVIVRRIAESLSARPLLAGKTAMEAEKFLGELLSKRLPLYRRAKYILSGANIGKEDFRKIGIL